MRRTNNVSTTTSGRPPSSRMLRSITVLTVSVATMAASFSGAVFTDSDDVTASGVVTGDIDLTTAATVDFVLTNMAPGDSASVEELTITNSGSLALRYALTSTTDEDVLAAELDLDVWLESQEAGSDGTCDDVTPGSYLYQGIVGSVAGTAVFGDSSAGSDVGDRTLAAAANEVLCFDVSLPIGTGNTVQSVTTNVTFTFDSEQTVNNA